MANGCTNPGEAKRVKFYNNLIKLGNTTQVGFTSGYAFGGIVFQGVTDFVFQHNTVLGPQNLGYCKASVYFDPGPPKSPPHSATHNVWVLDNELCRQVNGPRGYIGQFPAVLPEYMGDPAPAEPRLLGNVFYALSGEKVYPLPPRNSSAAVMPTDSKDSVQHTNHPMKTETSDGHVAGVDKSKLASAYSAESGINLSTRSEDSTGAPEPKQ